MESLPKNHQSTESGHMVPIDAKDPIDTCMPFQGLRLGTNNRTVIARPVIAWLEFREASKLKDISMHMIWIDKKARLIESMVDEKDITEISSKIKVGNLYRLDSVVAVPARENPRIVPGELRIHITPEQNISRIDEDPDDPDPRMPAGWDIGMAFSIVPLQKNTIDYHTDITVCIRRVSVPTTVRGTLQEFHMVVQDVSGAKAIVQYRGYDISKFLENAPATEAHLPLIVTIKSAMRVTPLSSQKYKYRFESTPASELMIRSYTGSVKEIMHIFLYSRMQVYYMDGNTYKKIGCLRPRIEKKTLADIKAMLAFDQSCHKVLYRAKFHISQLKFRKSICRTTEEWPGLLYQLEVKCEQGSGDIDVILDHEATLSIIGMSPNKYKKLDSESAKALLIKKKVWQNVCRRAVHRFLRFEEQNFISRTSHKSFNTLAYLENGQVIININDEKTF